MSNTLYDKIRALCEAKKISIKRMERDLGLADGSARKWNVSMPSADKLFAIAEYFNVSPESLVKQDSSPEYYIDPEVAYMAQDLKDRPELKVLFDASKSMTKNDIEFVIAMIDKMRK